MKVKLMEGGVGAVVVLSRRNLLSLLHKVDLPAGASNRTLVKETEEGVIVVQAEPDEAHYGDKAPGRMEESTEAFIKRLDAMIGSN